MVVRPVELSCWERPVNPLEKGLVAGMHAQRDVGLPAIAAEVAFTDQRSHQHALVEISGQ
jgi:hypothetical protein